MCEVAIFCEEGKEERDIKSINFRITLFVLTTAGIFDAFALLGATPTPKFCPSVSPTSWTSLPCKGFTFCDEF